MNGRTMQRRAMLAGAAWAAIAAMPAWAQATGAPTAPGGATQDDTQGQVGEPAPKPGAADVLRGRRVGSQQVTPSSNIYASIANGLKSGGFNQRASVPEDASYDPETNTTYEIGSKNTFSATGCSSTSRCTGSTRTASRSRGPART